MSDSSSRPPRPAGSPVIPDHDLSEMIGRGSYGDVWLARTVTGARRAVKVVDCARFDSARPFHREFAGIQRFDPVSRTHAGLVHILQVGRNDEAGFFYYVMELADDASETEPAPGGVDAQTGGAGSPAEPPRYRTRSLASELKRYHRLTITEAVPLFLQMADALAHLHRHGLVHRDLKPSNIIFVRGLAKLADIGLVTEAGATRSYVGTEGYIPPEGPGTRQADIYALGLVLYEAVTGRDRMEFPAIPPEAAKWPDVRQVAEVNAILSRACALNPVERYHTAEEMHADLALLQSGRSVVGHQRLRQRLRWATRIGAAAAVIAVGATGLGWCSAQRADTEHQLRQDAERARRDAERARLLGRSAEMAGRLEASVIAPGSRREALQVIAEAARLAPGVEMRNRAVTALLCPDLEPVPLNFPDDILWAVPAPDLVHWAVQRPARVEFGEPGQPPLCVPGTGAGNPLISAFLINDSGNTAWGVSAQNELIYWSLPSGKILSSSARPPDLIWDWVHPDGTAATRLLTENRIALVALPEGNVLRESAAPLPGASVAVVLPGGGTMTRAQERADRLGDRVSLQGENGAVTTIRVPGQTHEMTWTRDGKIIALCGGPAAQIWSGRSNDWSENAVAGHDGELVSAAFLDDLGLLLTTSWDGTAILHDYRLAKSLARFSTAGDTLRSNPAARLVAWRSWSPGRPALHRIIPPFALRMLAVEPGVLRGPRPWELSFSADGRCLACATWGGVLLWDTAEGKIAGTLPGKTFSAVFRPQQQDIVTSGDEGVRRWPASDENGALTIGPPELITPGMTQRMAFSRDGACSALTFGNEIWCLRGAEVLRKLPGNFSYNTLVAVSPDGASFAASDFNISSGYLISSATAAVTDLKECCTPEWSPDGKWFVTCGTHALTIRNSAGSVVLKEPRPQAANFRGPLAFSADGRLLAWATSRSDLRFVETDTWQEVLSLRLRIRGTLTSMAFSRDGRWFAASMEEEGIHLINLAALRTELAALGLDWSPALAPAAPTAPLRVEVRTGDAVSASLPAGAAAAPASLSPTLLDRARKVLGTLLGAGEAKSPPPAASAVLPEPE